MLFWKMIFNGHNKKLLCMLYYNTYNNTYGIHLNIITIIRINNYHFW